MAKHMVCSASPPTNRYDYTPVRQSYFPNRKRGEEMNDEWEYEMTWRDMGGSPGEVSEELVT